MNTILFKRAMFGGFRRDEVLAYVEKLEKENEELQIAKSGEIDRLKEELASWQTQYEELKNSTALTISQMEEKMKSAEAEWKNRYDELHKNTSLTINLLKAQLDGYQNESNSIAVREKRGTVWGRLWGRDTK